MTDLADRALLSAALRHARDAEHLCRSTSDCSYVSLDQAFHLAGFGPECARKAAIASDWLNKLLGHHLGSLADEMLTLAAALEPMASRYELRGWETKYPSLKAWDPQSRYRANGAHQQSEVDLLLQEANAAMVEILAAIWADGRMPPGVVA